MITEPILNYVSQWAFVYQLTAGLLVFNGFRVVSYYLKRYKRFQIFKYYGIPGPKPSLIDGLARNYYQKDQLFEFDKEMWQKYGSTWAGFLGDWPLMVTTDPLILRRVFLEDYETFSERTRPFMDIIVAYGILFCPRNRWKFIRKSLTPHFARFTTRNSSSTQFIEDGVQLMIKYLDEKIDEAEKHNKQFDVDLYDLIKSQSLYVISELALKLPVEVKEKEQTVIDLDNFMKHSDKLAFRICLIMPWFRTFFSHLMNYVQVYGIMAKLYEKLNERVSVVKKRLDKDLKLGLSAPDNEHMLDMLIRMEHRNYITHKELLGNAESILIAGYDTTSTTLIYALWAISKHPEVQDRLLKEVLANGTDSKYLEQVLNETMRLWPVAQAFVSRLCTKSIEINGVMIPEDTLVIYSAYIMHRHPDYWQNPDKFDPDRFEDEKSIDPLYFAPFGLGERRCLGYKLAMLEMKIVLCELIIRYKLNLISPLEMEMISFGYSLTKPKHKVQIKLEKRQ